MPPDDRRAFWRGWWRGLGLVAACTGVWWGVDLARLAMTEPRTTTDAMNERLLLVRLNEIRTATFHHRCGVADMLEQLILDIQRDSNIRLAKIVGGDPSERKSSLRLAHGTEREP